MLNGAIVGPTHMFVGLHFDIRPTDCKKLKRTSMGWPV
jgi:hypothetical protein